MADLTQLNDEDMLVAAIRETREAAALYGWDEYTTRFALGQMYAGTVAGNHELEQIWSRETAAPQGALDLHLAEGSITGHTAPADKFAKLVAGVADATKEIAKKALGRQRYTSPVLIRGVGQGSVRLVLEVVPHADDNRDDSMGELPSVDSSALRTVAAIINSADVDRDEDPDYSPLTAQISHLPTKARSALRKVAKQIASEQWHVQGRVEQRGFLPADLSITPAGARRLEVELNSQETTPKSVTQYGQIEGTIDIERIVWFLPEGGRRFRATATDQETAEAALDLQKGHPRVIAQFVVYEAMGAGDDVTRRSWELTAVRKAPESDAGDGEQGSLEWNIVDGPDRGEA